MKRNTVKMSDIPERVRANIKTMLDEATKNININEVMKSMLTQICYEMYKAGWRESYKVFTTTLEMQKNMFHGKDGEIK